MPDSKPSGKWRSLDRVVAVVFCIWCVVLAVAVLLDPASEWLVDKHEELSARLALISPLARLGTLLGSLIGLVGIVGVWMDKRRPLAIVACCALLQLVAFLQPVVHHPAWWPILLAPAALASYFAARFWMREMIPRYR